MPRSNAVLTAAALSLSAAASVSAQAPSEDWTRPYGQAAGSETRPYVGARDANGNRLVINGILQGGSGAGYATGSTRTVTSGVGAGEGGYGAAALAFSQSNAIGNQLNVIVQGRNNTVVVNADQTNTGDIIAGSGAQANAGGVGASAVTEARDDQD